jgi:DNA-directed RNA polymerase specialized sigma24 family protein
MRMTEEIVNEYKSLVKTVAASKHKEFPMIPADDIEQELWMWFITHPAKTKEWGEMESKKESTKLFVRSLNNHANRYCQNEKAKTIGYEMVDLTFYQRSVVEQLLPSVLSGDWNQPVYFDMTSDRHTQAPNEGGNLMAMQADISRAFELISESHQNVLIQWYLSNRNSKDLAKIFDTNEKTARMRVTRAIDSIINKLGGRAPYYEKDYKKPPEETISV